MNTEKPRSGGLLPPTGPVGNTAPDRLEDGVAAATGHPFVRRSGYVGTLAAGGPKKPPTITHGRHPRGYRRPDRVILQEIRQRLCDRPDIEAAEVHVSVAGGLVRLTGVVPDEQQKRRIEDCVRNVTGVRRVGNGIRSKA